MKWGGRSRGQSGLGRLGSVGWRLRQEGRRPGLVSVSCDGKEGGCCGVALARPLELILGNAGQGGSKRIPSWLRSVPPTPLPKAFFSWETGPWKGSDSSQDTSQGHKCQASSCSPAWGLEEPGMPPLEAGRRDPPWLHPSLGEKH